MLFKNKNLPFLTTDLTFITEALLEEYHHALHGNANLSNQFGKKYPPHAALNIVTENKLI